MFVKCLMKCYNREEFEASWTEMIDTFELRGEPWFDRLYGLKEKWCTALNKDFFSAGFLSSQRVESAHFAICFRANSNTTLTEFFKIFEDTVNRWRDRERANEYICTTKTVTSSVGPMSGLLKHASEVYTVILFRDFEEEYKRALYADIRILTGIGDDILMAEIASNDKGAHKHTATYIRSQNVLCCSCKNYEEAGLLCFHCIRLLHSQGVNRIPEQYIKQRWTKYAKREVWDRFEEKERQKGGPNLVVPWRHTMQRRHYNLFLKCSDSSEAREIVEVNFQKTWEAVAKLNLNGDDADAAAGGATADDTTSDAQSALTSITNSSAPKVRIIDPDRVKTKGPDKRKKGFMETLKPKKGKKPAAEKGKGKSAKKNTTEIGTKTPQFQMPERLF